MGEWVRCGRETDSEYKPPAMGTEEMEGLILKTGLFREGFMEEADFDLSSERLRMIFRD